MSKASLIRQIVAAGYTGKSPNTLRRWSLDDLQALLASLEPAIELPRWDREELQSMLDAATPMTPHVVSEDMEAYVASVEMPAPVSVPSDRELYVLSLRQREPAPIKVERPLSRWIALAMAPWTFLTQVCGIA
jgi:hypothetical protein